MALHSRCKTLLALLLQAPGPLTSQELADRTSLSPRAVRYSLDSVERWLAGKSISLIRKPNYGFEIDASRQVKDNLVHNLDQLSTQDLILSPNERVDLILLLLLSAEEPLLIQQLLRSLGVSRRTVVTDLNRAEEWLQRHKLALTRRANFGVQLEGSEADIREALVSLLIETVGQGKLLGLCGGSRLSLRLQWVAPTSDLYLRSAESVCARLPYARTIVDSWDESTGSLLTDDRYVWLILYLAVAMDRIAAGRHAEPEPEQRLVASAACSDTAAVTVVRRIERHLGCRLSPGDSDGIAAHLHSALGVKSTPQPTAEDPALRGCDVDALVAAMLDEAAAYLHPCLMIDGELRQRLLGHLLCSWDQLSTGSAVSNPLLREIQDYDRYVYQVAERCGDILASALNQRVPADEIGYIAMHLAAAMERARPTQPARRRVLVVCGEGSATVWLLVSRLRAEFPDIEITDAKSARQVTYQDLVDADIVVSTYPLSTEKAAVHVVSPLLTAGDIAALRNLLTTGGPACPSAPEESVVSPGPRLCDLIKPYYVALGIRTTSPLDVIDRATGLLMSAGAVDARFGVAVKQSLLAHGPYMVSVPGVALLHTRPGIGVSRLAMALMTLTPAVEFGHPENDPVDIAFALAAVDHRAHRRALLDLLSVVRDESTLRAIRQARTAEGICDVLVAVSEATDAAGLPIEL